jgi:hypothetical protein
MFGGALLAAAAATFAVARERPKQTVAATLPAATSTVKTAPASAVATAPATGQATECAVGVGARLAFEVNLATDLEVSGAGLVPGARSQSAGAPERIHATSTGHVDVLGLPAREPAESLVALRFTSLASEPSEPPELAASHADALKPVLVRLSPSCRIVAVARQKSVSALAYQRVIAMLDRIDVAARPDIAGASTWTASHRDEYGTFLASYSARDTGVERRRLHYVRGRVARDELQLAYVVHEGRATVRLGTSGWFDELAELTDIEAKSNGATPLRDRSSLRWSATAPNDEAFDGFDLSPEAFTWGRPSAGELDDERTALLDAKLKGLSFTDAWQAFRTASNDKRPGAWHRAHKALRAWMRLNPEGVRTVAQELRRGRLGSGEQADLVLALAKSGSAVAAAELRALASAANLDENTRVQATSALADLDHPTLADVQTLATLAARSNASAHDMVGSSATMSLGSILKGANDGDVVAAARATISGQLASAAPAVQAEALWAVGNSGDTHFAAAALSASSSSDDSVRAASARAVRGMPPATATPLLDSLVRSDQSAEVVKEVAQAQRQILETYGTALSPEQVMLNRTKLPSSPVAVRAEIIRLLGEAAKLQPAARAALAWWYPLETVTQNKVLIGSYVKASDLQ